MSLIAVSFCSFFSLKRFLISLIIFSSPDLGFLISIHYEKKHFLKKNLLKLFLILSLINVVFNQY